MKFIGTLNGEKITRDIPTSWDDVTFEQYLKLVDVQSDPVGILSVFVGIDVETLNSVQIVGLEAILEALSFTSVQPAGDLPKTILGYKIPKDLAFQTTGQFKDAQAIVNSMKPEGNTLSKEDQMKYLDLVAIFADAKYLDRSADEKDLFRNKFLQAPCGEVLAVGNFTLLKLIGLKLGIKTASLNKIGVLKKLRLVIKVWLTNMVFSLRYARLKRKLG